MKRKTAKIVEIGFALINDSIDYNRLCAARNLCAFVAPFQSARFHESKNKYYFYIYVISGFLLDFASF